MRRRTARILLAAAVILLVALGGVFFCAYRTAAGSLARYSGTVSLPDLSAPASVRYDRYGIPTIRAENIRDLAYVQGYVTAQDRLWQMDLTRRAADGRLAEVFGAPALDSDRLFRTLRLSRLAKVILLRIPDELRGLLESYAAGVNQYLAEHGDALAPEFRMLGYRPEPWRPEDTLLAGKLMHWRLTRTYPLDRMRERLQQALGAEASVLLPESSDYDFYLFPTPEDWIPPPQPETLPELPLEPLPAAPPPLPPPVPPPRNPPPAALTGGIAGALPETVPASNNWVVAGARSRSGKPILANDPHLWHGIPSVWHIVQLQLPDRRLAGATFPGAPGIVLGNNGRIAWAVTNVEADNQDLYRIEFTDDSGVFYQVDGLPEASETAVEQIAVRDGQVENLQVVSTRFGPIIERDGRNGLALRWSGLELGSELQAFYELWSAGDWETFRKALETLPGPPSNFLYADTNGNIGYQVAGWFPIRQEGDGTLPRNGDSSSAAWLGWVPFEKLPSVYNPPSGWLVTANNRMVDDRYPYVLNRHWAPAYRAARIRTLIEADRALTVDGVRRIQSDTYSYADAALARELAQALAQSRRRSAEDEWIYNELRNWDGHVRRNTVAPALTWYARQALQDLLLIPRLGRELAGQYSWMQSSVFVQKAIEGQDPAWLPARTVRTRLDPAEGFQERVLTGWDDLQRHALTVAAGYLRRTQGPTPLDHWRWGRINAVRFEHPMGRFWPLDRLLNSEPVEMEGNSMTVNVQRPGFGVSMRLVIDMADMQTTHVQITTGQSGHFLSPHYLDQLPLWRSTQLIPLSQTDEARQSAGGVLQFTP